MDYIYTVVCTPPSHIKCQPPPPPTDAPHHDGLGGGLLGLRQALWKEPLTVCPPNSNTPIVLRQIESALI